MTDALIYETWVCDHLHYATALDMLMEEIELVLRKGPRTVAMLLGPSGMGKTELLQDIEVRFSDRSTETGRPAVFYVAFPAGTTSDAVAARIIKKILGIPIVKGTAAELRERAIRLLASSGIQVLILDEANHAAEAHSTRATQTKANRLTADWIKEVVDDAKVSVVLAGLPHARRLLTDNEQLEGRALRAIELNPYAWHIDGDRVAFCGLVGEFVGYARHRGWTISVPDDHLTRATYLTCRGLVRPIRRLFERALILSEKDRTVTASVLARAFDKCFPERLVGNPFELETIPDQLLNDAHRQLLHAIHEPLQSNRRRKEQTYRD